MANLKHIAATLALLGTASFAVTGCGKKGGEGTEAPTEDAAKNAEGSCSAEGGGGDEAGGDEGGGDEGGDEGGEEAEPEA